MPSLISYDGGMVGTNVLLDVTPARIWQLRTRRLTFRRLPHIMGIVNVTPDSFSDGGQYFDPQRAVDHALHLIDAGADLLDIGGESTRPYAEPVSTAEELRRVLPVIEGLRNARVSVPLSIDTSKALVARDAVDRGVEIVNDVTGLQGDAGMLPFALESQVGLCVMHMQGTPQTMQENPRYADVVADIYEYLGKRREALISAGIHATRICLDPGIGFGKTHAHNLQLMRSCYRFHDLGSPLLVGHSRKGFLAKIIGDKKADRVAATVGSAISLAAQNVQVLRVHDVQPLRQTLTAMLETLPEPILQSWPD